MPPEHTTEVVHRRSRAQVHANTLRGADRGPGGFVERRRDVRRPPHDGALHGAPPRHGERHLIGQADAVPFPVAGADAPVPVDDVLWRRVWGRHSFNTSQGPQGFRDVFCVCLFFIYKKNSSRIIKQTKRHFI